MSEPAVSPHRPGKTLSMAASILCLFLAAPPDTHAARHYPKAIKHAMANGVKVVTTFPATSGLTGWVLNRDGTYSMAFTTADGKTLIMGTLINEKGENLTDQYAEKYFPKPDPAALYKQLEQSSYVTEDGNSAPKSILYAFVDANCPDCRSLWKALRPYQRIGLQVRWVPIATPEPGSMQKAVDLLDANDKTQALARMLEGTDKNSVPTPAQSGPARPALANKIKKNNALMEKFGLADAPVVVWTDSTGKAQIKAGMPRLSDLPRITGLPQQKVDDPELEKFK